MAWGERRPNMPKPPVTEDWQLNALCSWIDKMFTQPRVAPSAEPNTKSMEGESHLWEYVYTVANDEPTVLVLAGRGPDAPGRPALARGAAPRARVQEPAAAS